MAGAEVQRGFVADPAVHAVRHLDIRMSGEPLPFAVREAGPIGERWRAAVAANPALYDGPILLFSDFTVADGRLSATAHRTGFSSLLHLVDVDDREGRAKNLFGAAAVVAADAVHLLGRMGPKTAFPGTVKCAGGTPDDLDVRDDGRVDILGSIVRELAEETGLEAAAARHEPDLVVVVDGPLVAVHAVLHFPEPAAALAARIEAFLAADADPELAGVVAIGPDDRLDGHAMPGYTRAFLAGRFRRQHQGQR